MGAFFGPISAMAGLAANSRAQGQRQAQLDAIEQLKAQGLMEENAAGAMNLQDAMSQRAARQKLLDDPNTDPLLKQMLAAGLPAEVVNSLKTQKQNQAAAALYSGVARLQKGDLSGAMNLAAQARAAGVEPSDIKEAFAGTEFFKDPESEEVKQLNLLLKEKALEKPDKPVSPYAGAVSWRTETDPTTGRDIQVPYAVDRTGKLTRVPFGSEAGATLGGAIPGKLNANEKRLIDSVNDIAEMMPDMPEMIDALGNPSSVELAMQWAKYRAPFGALGAVDPKFAAYFNSLGQIQTDLISAATTGGSRAMRLIDMLKPHIPSPTDPPDRAMEKLKGFDMGRFNAIRKTLLGTGPTPGSRPLEGSGGTDGTGGSFTPGGIAPAPPPPGFK